MVKGILHYNYNHAKSKSICGIRISRPLFSNLKIYPSTLHIEKVSCKNCQQRILGLIKLWKDGQ